MKKYNKLKVLLINFIFGIIVIAIFSYIYDKGFLGDNSTPLLYFMPSLLFNMFVTSLFYENDLSLFLSHLKKEEYSVDAYMNFKLEVKNRIIISAVPIILLIVFYIITQSEYNGIITGLALSFSTMILLSIVSLKLSVFK